MQALTSSAQQQLRDIATRYGVSEDAARTLFDAVVRGNGTMAQFSHPELGGSGQWMMGGMTMVGDMFNNSLKATVDGLCMELSNLYATAPFEPPPPSPSQQHSQGSGMTGFSVMVPNSSFNWWPAELGSPSSSGAQNDIKYAYFPGPRRLAIQVNGQTSIYDTLDHQIGGVSQQQGGSSTLTFSSQYGTVPLDQLPLINGGDTASNPSASNPEPMSSPSTSSPQPLSNPSLSNPSLSNPSNAASPEPMTSGVDDMASRFSVPPPMVENYEMPSTVTDALSASEEDIISKIERLGELRSKGILSEEEFVAKKTELLKRI